MWCHSHWCDFYDLTQICQFQRFSTLPPLDLKPENVLICIDDVESIIQAELEAQSASQTPPPTRLVGVPPSRGRGGNQTPRSESVFITGSQPLPSPSSSFGSSSHLDRWAFGMSKIDGDGESKPASLGSSSKAITAKDDKRADSTEQAAERISNVKLDSEPFGEKAKPTSTSKAIGPSLLSQQAPSSGSQPTAPPLSTTSSNPPPYSPAEATGRSAAPNPPLSATEMDTEDSEPMIDGTEKITVKIADLGNGMLHSIYSTKSLF